MGAWRAPVCTCTRSVQNVRELFVLWAMLLLIVTAQFAAVMGSLVCRMGAESLKCLVQSTCRTSLCKHVSYFWWHVGISALNEQRVWVKFCFNWEKNSQKHLGCRRKCLVTKLWAVRRPTSIREDSRTVKNRSKTIDVFFDYVCVVHHEFFLTVRQLMRSLVSKS